MCSLAVVFKATRRVLAVRRGGGAVSATHARGIGAVERTTNLVNVNAWTVSADFNRSLLLPAAKIASGWLSWLEREIHNLKVAMRVHCALHDTVRSSLWTQTFFWSDREFAPLRCSVELPPSCPAACLRAPAGLPWEPLAGSVLPSFRKS